MVPSFFSHCITHHASRFTSLFNSNMFQHWSMPSKWSSWQFFATCQNEFYVLLTMHPGMILVNNQLDALFFCMFISILYMFQAAMCPSSGELLHQCDTWFMSLCVDGHLVYIPDGHLHSDINQVSQFSWSWAHGCPKHVENRNKHTKKMCIKLVIYKEHQNDASTLCICTYCGVRWSILHCLSYSIDVFTFNSFTSVCLLLFTNSDYQVFTILMLHTPCIIMFCIAFYLPEMNVHVL